MKNKDIFKIRKILEQYKDIKNKEFSFVILKNIELCDVLINTFNNLKVIDNTDYILQKKRLINKYSDGYLNDKFIIKEEFKDIFNDEMDNLDYNFIKTTELLNNECKIIFFKIDKDILPDMLSVNDILDINFMIK